MSNLPSYMESYSDAEHETYWGTEPIEQEPPFDEDYYKDE